MYIFNSAKSKGMIVNKPMLNAGLTGGIAGGKSTVGEYFRAKGAYLIEHDLLTRKVQEPDEVAWRNILRHFGEHILNPDRSLNREKLGSIVFSNPQELKKLNEIVHPAVYAEWKKEISRIERERPDAIIISDIPLLIEVQWTHEVDVIIVVFVSPEEQLNRLMQRNGLAPEDARRRIDAQMPIADKLRYADFVIDNSGSIEQTKTAIDSVWEKLLELEQNKRKRP